MFALATSFVGFEAAVSFNDFAQNYDRQVTVEQLLRGERGETLESFGLNDHCALVEKLDASGACKKELKDEELKNLAGYFLTLPSEASMKLWNVIAGENSVQDNVIRFHKMGTEDKTVGTHLAEILGGTSENK
jgi:hypothetical protein